MAKIVVNGCFGGFGLSDTAVRRYAEIAGITLYEHIDDFEFVSWSTVPREEYERMTLEGDFLGANAAHFSVYDLSRTDPVLVQVVEELGDAANDLYADLYIVELPAGIQYRIDEYDGNESVMTIDDYEWSVA